MAYICNSCSCVITGKAFARNEEVNVGKIGWGWGWSQKGKLRFTSNRKLYRNKTVYYCEECITASTKTNPFVSTIAFFITGALIFYLFFSGNKKSETEKKIVAPPVVEIAPTEDRIKGDTVSENTPEYHAQPVNKEEGQCSDKDDIKDSESLNGSKKFSE